MKLILANNQTERFTAFYRDLRAQSGLAFDYAGYESLLFIFNGDDSKPIEVMCTTTGKSLTEYDGVYLNGYLDTYELAATTAICCTNLGVPFVNHELADPPSLSKLTGYAKLVAAGVNIPLTLAGSKTALSTIGNQQLALLQFPIVLKRADADRGVDNFKVTSIEEMREILAPYPPRSIWIAQNYIPNDGFYLVTFYDQKPAFCIFRSLEVRPDHDERKAHMYKPKGGVNARFVELSDMPVSVATMSQKAIEAMDRQIGSVDCLLDEEGKTYILEVNYNPQLVTVSIFQDARRKAFIEGLQAID
jgi:glutathione synthase/RimK-type ligase-like ATP-grasp enzyme